MKSKFKFIKILGCDVPYPPPEKRYYINEYVSIERGKKKRNDWADMRVFYNDKLITFAELLWMERRDPITPYFSLVQELIFTNEDGLYPPPNELGRSMYGRFADGVPYSAITLENFKGYYNRFRDSGWKWNVDKINS